MTTPRDAPSSAQAEPREGLVLLGKYRLLRKLGAGGMGEVWLAQNLTTEREFAIKLLLAKHAADGEILARFMREAKVSGRVRHPGVVEVFDVAHAPELGGAVFLVMEVLHGASLHDLVTYQRQLPLRFVLDVAIAIAHALGALHDKGVVHRDIKPSNIFLHKDPAGTFVPKLLDFGISKVEAASPDEGELTRSGTVVGSPRYMSPEQAAGRKDVDARADVHGLGVAIWTCVAGYSPFDSSNYNNMIVSVITTDRRPLREVVPSVPQAVSDVVARAVARVRDARYANGHELAAALEKARESVTDGPSLSLDSRAWLEDLVAKAAAAPSSTRSGAAHDPSKSVGAVSVSFDETAALQETKRATDSALARMQGPPTSSPLPRPAPTGSSSTLGSAVLPKSKGLGIAIAAAFACAAVIVFVAVRARTPAAPERRAATATTTTTTPTTATASATASATATATATATSDVDGVDAGARVATTATPKKAPARPPVKGPVAPAGSDPHRGVTTSGL